MVQDIRRHELVEATTEEEAGIMKQQRRVEEAQRLRQDKKAAEAMAARPASKAGDDTGPAATKAGAKAKPANKIG